LKDRLIERQTGYQKTIERHAASVHAGHDYKAIATCTPNLSAKWLVSPVFSGTAVFCRVDPFFCHHYLSASMKLLNGKIFTNNSIKKF
jgi:hypothetical protein